MLVDDLQNIVDTYVTDPFTAGMVGGLDDLARLRVQIDRLEAAFALGVAAADARGDMEATGRTTAEWVGLECRRSHDEAKRVVSFAKKLGWTDRVKTGFVTGTLSAEQARMVTRVLTKQNVSFFAEHEESLVAIAEQFNMAQFGQALQHWRKRADDFTAKNDAKNAEDARELFCSPVGDTFVLKGTLTAEQGTIVNEAITMISQAESDGSTDPRTLAQRRADAITSICRYALDTNTTRTIHGSRPHIEVLVDLEDFLALGNAVTSGDKAKYGGYTPAGAWISGVTLERICCDARITHTLRDASQSVGAGATHEGRTTDTIPKHIRRKVIARDRHCRYPGCCRPAVWSEIHHIKHREHGGEHTVTNLVLLCGRHHQRIHAFNETLVLHPNGALTVTSAGGITRTSHPPPNLNKHLKPKTKPVPVEKSEPETVPPIIRARTNECSRNITLTPELSALLEQHMHETSICSRAHTSRQLPNMPIDYLKWSDNGLTPVFHETD
jgi:Domain of unknown function (DUF222)/HNH endonuclease